MTIHTQHPSISEHGLADGCPRCKEHGEHPFEGLDDTNIERLIDRIADEADSRSISEDNAMRVVGKAILRANALYRLGWRPWS